jgi:hypothetical protein
MNVNFVEMAQTRLRDLKERDGHLESTERGIAEQRRTLKAEIDRVNAALEVYREFTGMPSAEPPRDQATLVTGDLKDMTIADACELIMQAQGGQADVTMLLRTLVQVGKVGTARGAYGTIVNTLKRFPNRFFKVKPGRWGLVQHAKNEVQAAMLR